MFNRKKYMKEYYKKNKQVIKKRAEDWYLGNKEKVSSRQKDNSAKIKIKYNIWRKNNKRAILEREKEYRNRCPWVKTYQSIIRRCKHNPFYLKKGITSDITVRELKTLWERDNAGAMHQPSIDRIDRGKGYFFDNCRYLELKENIRRRVFKKVNRR